LRSNDGFDADGGGDGDGAIVDGAIVDGAIVDTAPIQNRIEANLRDQILHGAIPPGGRINVRQLETVYGVSHIPIREAIRRLEGEGLVVNVPKRGAVAADVSLRELDEIYDLRRIVEPPVARRAVLGVTVAQLAHIRHAYERLEVAERGPADESFSLAHWDFHWSLLAPGATGEVERLVHKLWRVADRYVRLTKAVAIDVAHEHHRQLCEAFEARDAETAAEVLERHLHLTGDALRTKFNQINADTRGGS
jgi:DNA-binding GntR family transcriptional regulator